MLLRTCDTPDETTVKHVQKGYNSQARLFRDALLFVSTPAVDIKPNDFLVLSLHCHVLRNKYHIALRWFSVFIGFHHFFRVVTFSHIDTQYT
ncbi:hypothetical protein TNIN_203981 [Trichonephila inaurata madagascariensis]|uniref:Uncharacterized protein n=1 Tax=Trichonephila inaurata madagascariensis TaxID=2747483 RepID=A0A8X6X3N6_9ARAC|nr:hypothetical protein TNIN_203981 [Trichonephila inaurata madagascariensis]